MDFKNILGSSSIETYRQGYVDPLLENKNYSGNDLDIVDKWYGLKDKPPRYFLEHRNDEIKHTGYDYRGKILKRTLSPILYLEPKRKGILEIMEIPVTFLVDYIKSIKKQFNFYLEKDYRNFN